MKFIKPIDLWEDGVQDRIRSGQLKLQCGQWVKCGYSGYSRFISVEGKVFNIVHPRSRMEKIFRMRALGVKVVKAQYALAKLQTKYEVSLFEHELGK